MGDRGRSWGLWALAPGTGQRVRKQPCRLGAGPPRLGADLPEVNPWRSFCLGTPREGWGPRGLGPPEAASSRSQGRPAELDYYVCGQPCPDGALARVSELIASGPAPTASESLDDEQAQWAGGPPGWGFLPCAA